MDVDLENVPNELEVKRSLVHAESFGGYLSFAACFATFIECVDNWSLVFVSGVFCRTKIAEGDKFGPMDGERVQEEQPHMNFDLVFKVSGGIHICLKMS